MLASQLGVRLILWMGQTVPLPAPTEALDALTRVEVTNDAQNGDGFQITFTLARTQPGEYDLLRSGALQPSTRVIVGVLLGTTPEVLIDGIITHHQHVPSSDPGGSTLTVTGRDVSIMLDLKEKNEKYENQPDYLIVTQLIAGYAQYGLVPKVTPTSDVPIMLQRIPRQHETDLRFIRRMGERNGFVFYVEPLTFGVNTAYWGPQSRTGLPQAALTLGPSPSSNLVSLSFSQDALAPVNTSGTFLEPITKTAIPIPQLPSLRVPPLALTPTAALRTILLRDTSNQDAGQAATSALAAITNSPDAVTGEGEVDSVRYGHVLRARKLVGLRGAGISYDGAYYVSRVTHTIVRGDYKQSFSLSREGTGSILPVVQP
ncbi:MAG: phage late control D family protein [Vicinamibacterales bacterium]